MVIRFSSYETPIYSITIPDNAKKVTFELSDKQALATQVQDIVAKTPAIKEIEFYDREKTE